ncbi:MAG: hypothetical protein KC731_10580 [Myxococcales bacterium]|nr:hypothetical protein [Myxococcales bacterium]
MTSPDWQALATTIGRADQVPALLRQLRSPAKTKRQRAIDELTPLLTEDGDRSEAAVAAIPLLAASLADLPPDTRLAVLELLAWLAVGDPSRALCEHLEPVTTRDPATAWHRVGATNTASYRAVEAAAPRLAEQLAANDPALRSAALGVLAVAPPRDGSLLARALDDAEPALRALGWVARVKQARYWGQPLDEVPTAAKGMAGLLLAGAALLHVPSRANWEALHRAVARTPKVRITGKAAKALPRALRDDGLLGWTMHLLVTSPAADHDALAATLERAAGAASSESLALLAAAIFVGDLRGVEPEALTASQRVVLRVMAASTDLDSSVSEVVLARGVPIAPLDDHVVSHAKAARSYLGLDRPDAYRRRLPGRHRRAEVSWPIYRWAHRFIAGEVTATALSSALKALPAETFVETASALTRPPEDLRGPDYDHRKLHQLLLRAATGRGDVVKVGRQRHRAGDLSAAQALWLLDLTGDDVDPDDRAHALSLERGPGSLELVRDHLDRLSTEEADEVVRAMELDEPEMLDRSPLLAAWDLVDYRSDRDEALAEALDLLLGASRPPETRSTVQRVCHALDLLQPSARAAVEAALRSKKTSRAHWRPTLEEWLSRQRAGA